MATIEEIFLTAFIEMLFEKLVCRDLRNSLQREWIDTLLTKWSRMLEQIGALLADAEVKQMTDQGIKSWLEDLEDLAYDLDDLLDELATEALKRKVMEGLRASTSKVRPLQQRHNGVVIHDDTDEQNLNLIPINEETERIEAMARKGKSIYVGEGNENSQGYPLEGRCVEVENLMDENIGQKVESAERSCIAISHSKKKNITDTPKKKYSKHSITLDDLRQHFGLKRVEAAKRLGVSVPTFKRYCRQNGIMWWNGDGCSLVEPKLLNNSVHQNSPGSKPPEVEGEKETSALLIAKQDMVTVKAKYGERTLKFQLSLESGVAELNEAVAKRVELELGNFIVEYEDEEQERVWIACDEDLQECVKFSSSLGNQVIRLLVTDKVSNSEKSCKSCKGQKRKRS